ncbi:ribonuclease R [Nitrospina watsonii]|uniref:Ribonuclease R n=1 Tax=Nitrospina watsonii TaxID=1323948 RepID=A0ABM9HC97_9BACT|nr:ribonuclease R [Nitrospina watsonii]CAI2717795.1 Ribonuclease R [Nitrospina watsonii]
MELSEAIVLKLLHEKTSRPMKFSELMKTLGIPETQRREFRHLIKDLANEGSVVKLRGGRYGLPDEMSLVSGQLHGHPDGYGFLIREGDEPDIYISRQKMGGAMHQDKIVVRIESQYRGFSRPEGRVIRILERRTQKMVGLFEALNRDGWVVPSDAKYFQDVFIPGKDTLDAKSNEMVRVEIVDYPTRHHPPVGRVVEVLGPADDPEVELRSIFHKHEARQEFPPKVERQVKKLSLAISDEERARRRDLTDDLIFTIDGERSKDFDDAVTLTREKDTYRLGVHIADVSHYVIEGSPLDEEAFLRGTSIYYAEGVIPMLPFKLSNEVCSLRPNEEHLTLSADIVFNKKGEVIDYEIYDSIIESKIRFTYTQVASLLEDGDLEGRFTEVLPMLKDMEQLSRTLRKKRFQEGSVDFNVPEAEILMTPDGYIQTIRKAPHNIAHEIIEEFMLSANRVVAEDLTKKSLPVIHRIHEEPDADRLQRFGEFAQDFGYRLPSQRQVKSTHLQKLLERARDKPEERALNYVLLRSMKKAVYSEKDPGHYCLGFQHYTHFTSPIRRYPDLFTHRVIKQFHGRKKCSLKERKQLMAKTAEAAEQSTSMEIKAMGVEREISDLRRVQFMADKIGQTYKGFISNVTSFGFFVELADVFVEGLVRVSTLADDYYIFYEHEHALKGQHKHKAYRLGDAVKVRVQRVDLAKKQIDLALVTR